MKPATEQRKPFLGGRLWRLDTTGRAWPVRVAIRLLRVLVTVALGFRRDRCALHASALTYYSLMALIPVLVVSLSVAKGLNADRLAKEFVEQKLEACLAEMEATAAKAAAPAATAPDTPPQVQRPVSEFSAQIRTIFQKGYDQIHSLDFGKLGAIGALGLLFGALGLLRKIEASFNAVWDAPRARSLWRSFTDYLIVLMILPLLLAAASSISVADLLRQGIAALDHTAADATAGFLQTRWVKTAATLLGTTGTFAFLLGYMPNVRVKFHAALLAGFATTLVFMAWLKACILFQVGIANYSTLYGGFATLPILLMWVYISWQIILFGAEFAFAIQSGDAWGLDALAAAASPTARILVSLAICDTVAAQSRTPNPKPLRSDDFAREKGLSPRLARSLVSRLEAQGILIEDAAHPGDYYLRPCATDLTAQTVVKAILEDGAALDEFARRGRGLDAFAPWQALLRQDPQPALQKPLA